MIDRRRVLGRAADCDVQLGDPEVSRHHAKIEVDDEGQVTLVDLSSTCGTFVGGVRIDRHVLVAGDVIVIGQFRLIFEEVDENVAERRPPAKRGLEVMRPTMRMAASPPTPAHPPAPPRRAPVRSPAPPVASRTPASPTTMPRAPRAAMDLGASATSVEKPKVPWPLVASPVLPWSVGDAHPRPLLPPPGMDPLVVRASAMALVSAVFEYRLLRLAQLGHEVLDHDELVRVHELEQQLEHGGGAGDPDSTRRYRRFGCAVPARLVRFDGRRIITASIALEDISAAGGHVRVTDMLDPGEACWLVVDLEDETAKPVVVFGARVVWATPSEDRLGLVFAGGVRSGVDGLALIRAELGVG